MNMMSRPVDAKDAAMRVAQLSEGQLECLKLVARHMSSKEIAAELDISPHTVDQRIRQSLAILDVSRRTQAARLVEDVHGRPYQRLIHQSPYIQPDPGPEQEEGTASNQIRHAGRAGSSGYGASKTEQDVTASRFSLQLPFATGRQPRNEMSVGTRLLWIVIIAFGAAFAAGMYLAGLESLARMLSS